ncbi:methylmalonyl-CoA mutase [Thalassospira sp.]|uniref:methylmalonyl-CoA mutase n=1 Tax=Thalassospira sp. TaxID=1912094 RepID=UPI002734F21B|nr:methylmalonyl-CoA mutase [Thalassospira sp.]MDP2697280.1 methylmalonyl-CoA mutase [Thalassospira sp.]
MTSVELASMLARFAELEGRHPRILIATGCLADETYLNLVASRFADGGFDVDIAPSGSDAVSISQQVVDCDADMLALVRVSVDHDDRVRVMDLQSALSAMDAEYIQFGIFGRPDDPARDNVDFLFDVAHFDIDDIISLMRFLLAVEEGRMVEGI